MTAIFFIIGVGFFAMLIGGFVGVCARSDTGAAMAPC